MRYVKKELTEKDLDIMRIVLSVQERKLNLEPSCDFCGVLNPKFVYASIRMSTGEWRPNWRWCACEDCSLAADEKDWERIKNKLVAWLQQRGFKYAAPDVLMGAAEMALGDFIRYAEEEE